MEELQQEFLTETAFFIEQIEESFLAIEEESKREEELSKIFRLMHSIKGAGGAVGLDELSKFAHKVEDVLSLLRANTSAVNRAVVTSLLKAIDALKERINALRKGDATPWNISEVQDEILSMTEKIKSGQSWNLGGNNEQTLSVKSSSATIEIEEVKGPHAVTESSSAIKKPKEFSLDVGTSKKIDANKQFVKVDTDRIDQVMDAVGELVVIKSQLINEAAPYLATNTKLTSIVSLFDRLIRDLQDKAMGMRLTPLKSTFLKLQRVVRDLSLKLNKPIDFVISGEDTEIDRNMVEALSDPLLHLVRNSLDHGVENAKVRASVGKNERGTIQLKAFVSSGRVCIEISDDGGGINTKKVFAKAQEKGIIPQNKKIDDYAEAEIHGFIFAPGFSTADAVTDVSGRGVGMDVVKTNVEKMKGSIVIESHQGKGTKFSLSLPMTASITDGILVKVCNNPILVPLNAVCEIIDHRGKVQLDVEQSGSYLNLRGKMIPIVDLTEVLKSFYSIANQKFERASEILIVVEHNGKQLALKVEEIAGQTQVVLKGLSTQIFEMPEIGGVAILGDGRVALVLDMVGLISIQDNPLREAVA